ncbi:MAG: polyprenol monophosphomannose synthase [Bacteroidales bacterium]
MMDSLVIIPTYNEKENIEKIIRKVFSLEKVFHILVVEDNSPDGTADIVKNLIEEFPNQLFIEERKGKLGLGTAYMHGFNWALKRKYEYIFEMDADFSHNPDDLIRLYDAVANQGADLAIGSRYCNGVNVVNWPMGRVLMSYYGSAYVRFITRLPIRDTTAGFKCYRRIVLENIDFSRIKHIGYGFQIEMKFNTYKLGFNVVEVPIIFTDRTEGTSKMSKGIFKEAIFGVIGLKWGSFFRKYERVK